MGLNQDVRGWSHCRSYMPEGVRKREIDEILSLVNRLDDQKRESLEYRYLKETSPMSYQDIADKVGRSPEQVRSEVYEALHDIRHLLAPSGPDWSDDIESLRLSARAKNALYRAGITSVHTLDATKLSELIEVRNLGTKGRKEISVALEKWREAVARTEDTADSAAQQ